MSAQQLLRSVWIFAHKIVYELNLFQFWNDIYELNYILNRKQNEWHDNILFVRNTCLASFMQFFSVTTKFHFYHT